MLAGLAYIIITFVAHVCFWFLAGVVRSYFVRCKIMKVSSCAAVAIFSTTLQSILHLYYGVI